MMAQIDPAELAQGIAGYMSETLQIWLFGACFLLICFAIVTGAGFAYAFSNRMTAIEIRFETWIESMGRRTAVAVHRDDDKFMIDRLLDKYRIEGDLSLDEWHQLRIVCDQVVSDRTVSYELKSGFVMLAAVCDQKTLPPTAKFWKRQAYFVHPG